MKGHQLIGEWRHLLKDEGAAAAAEYAVVVAFIAAAIAAAVSEFSLVGAYIAVTEKVAALVK